MQPSPESTIESHATVFAHAAPARRANHRFRSADPVSMRGRRSILTSSNFGLFFVTVGFGLFATGTFARCNALLDRTHAFIRAHNDEIVQGIIHWVPIALVASAAAVLAVLGYFFLQNWGRKPERPALNRTPAENSALAAALHGIVKQRQQELASGTGLLVAAGKVAGSPGARGPRGARHGDWPGPRLAPRTSFPLEQPQDEAEGVRRRRAAIEAADARAAMAADIVARNPAPLLSPTLDSPPTLPMAARVRRKDPHGPLPPPVAAALDPDSSCGPIAT